MKIAVIGGSGFIGTVLVRKLLEAGHKVSIFDIQESKAYPEKVTIVDVRDESAMMKSLKGFDVVYNLAAAHRDDVRPESLYFDTNVGGAENTVKAALANGIKHVIFTSSVALYGLNVGVPDESFPHRPFNAYGQSKAGAEKVFVKWQEADPTHQLTIVRPVAIFGVGNRGNIFNLIRQITGGKFVMVGNGENRKSIGYVENLTDFLVHALGFETGLNLFNYADKPDMTMNEFVRVVRESFGKSGVGFRLPYWIGIMGGWTFDALAAITGKTFPISSVRIRKFCADTQVSSEKAFATDFKAKHSLAEGLRVFIEAEFKDDNNTDQPVFSEAAE